MAKIVSFVVLVVILLLVGGLFLDVMGNFLVPLFLALLLTVVFRPLYHWFCARCRRHDRISAALTTASIILLVLIPLLALLTRAGYEAQGLYRAAVSGVEGDRPGARQGKPAHDPPPPDAAELANWLTAKLAELSQHLGITIDVQDVERTIGKYVQRLLEPVALLRTTQFLAQMCLSLLVIVLATYYFFADGPAILQATVRLSPLESGHARELIAQFGSVTRAVVSATLLTAFVEGLLMGVGFYVAGVSSVLLLTALSMVLVLVPFVGAAIAWVPICLWMAAMDHRLTAAVVLAAYCIAMLSVVDNVFKPWLLHGRSNLHPLLALLSVLGGVQVLGPIGILVGPMVVAFLQTLLEMVHSEIVGMTSAPAQSPLPLGQP